MGRVVNGRGTGSAGMGRKPPVKRGSSGGKSSYKGSSGGGAGHQGSGYKGVSKKKQHSRRALKAMQKKEPQLVEDERTALFMRSTTCNETMRTLLLDLYKIHGPETSKNFTRKTEERPFENDASFRFLCEKNNASLFALGSHTKKRPNNLVLARMFEFNVLDMFELGLSSIQTMSDFREETFAVGSRPFMVFQGDVFENHPTYQQLKSLFMDFFCSKPLVSFIPSALRQGHAIILTALPDGTVAFRHYRVDACAVEGRTSPGAQITEIGPRFNMKIDRTVAGADDMRKAAMRVPKQNKEIIGGKYKNKESSGMGHSMGRVHMQKQDLNTMNLMKFKGTKRKTSAVRRSGDAAARSDGADASGANPFRNTLGIQFE